MKCEVFINNLDAYLDEELLPDIVLKMQEHINQCSRCREIFIKRNRLIELISKYPEIKPSLEFKHRLLKMIKRVPQRRFKVLYPLSIAAILLLTILIFSLVKRHQPLERDERVGEYFSIEEVARLVATDNEVFPEDMDEKERLELLETLKSVEADEKEVIEEVVEIADEEVLELLEIYDILLLIDDFSELEEDSLG